MKHCPAASQTTQVGVPPMGQHPPQAWRDLYTIERGPPSPTEAMKAPQHG